MFIFSVIDVRHGETAEFFHDGQWHPICGHHFWDNDVGADLFCKKLGYDFGKIRPESTKSNPQVPLPKDGIRIGTCNEGDTFGSCTGGANELSIGGVTSSDCQSGVMAGLKIDCFVEGKYLQVFP